MDTGNSWDDVVSSLFVAVVHGDGDRWRSEVAALKQKYSEADWRVIRAELDEALARYKRNRVPVGQRIERPWQDCEEYPGFYRVGGIVEHARMGVHPATEAEHFKRRNEDRAAYRLSVCEADIALSAARLAECFQSGELVAIRDEELVLSGYLDKHRKLSARMASPVASRLPLLTLKEQRERKAAAREDRIAWAQGRRGR